ncbi:MAG TPA: ABC transporter permease [Ktedonobacteraceae bacterium]|nr:ABC transporter permease [Ktedonobacteraceae bacterium]
MDITNSLDISQEEIEPFLDETTALDQQRRSQLRIIFDRFVRNKVAIVGACFLIFMVVLCFLGPLVTGHNQPDVTHPLDSLKPPSAAYPLGTDLIGHDQFARVMYGGRLSLLVGLGSMLVAVFFGVTLGAFAGFYGGLIDNILMRVTDIALAVPAYLLLFLLSIAYSDGSPLSIILLISVLSWTYTARLVRGEFLALREREYVLAARTIGARGLRLMFRHILPNAAGPIIVNATLLIGANIIFESVLSYFGFGLQPPAASWGNMVADGKGLLDVAPWMVIAPGLLIFLTVLSSNLVGDGLRDALDPRMTER